MQTPVLTDTIGNFTSATRITGSEELPFGQAKSELGAPDKRTTFPKGGYRFGASNPALRPEVPKGC